MTLQTAMRWTMTLGMAALVGSTAAQDVSPVKSQQAGAQQLPAKAAAQGTTTKDQQETIVFSSAKDKLSYAVGVELAAGLKWQKMNVDLNLVIRGLQDAFSNDDSKLFMTKEDLVATLKNFQEDRKRSLEHAKQMSSEKNKRTGEDFVAQNAKKDGVVTLPSGLQYKVLKPGDGKKPTLDDAVVCHYRGTLLDGTEFDSSYKRNEPVTFPLKGVIKGWREALQLMPAGSKWQLVVPPQLAYGERGGGDLIGPNATLIFEVELLSIQDKAQTASAAR